MVLMLGGGGVEGGEAPLVGLGTRRAASCLYRGAPAVNPWFAAGFNDSG